MARLNNWEEVKEALSNAKTQDELDKISQENIELCYKNEFDWKYITFFQRKKIINNKK